MRPKTLDRIGRALTLAITLPLVGVAGGLALAAALECAAAFESIRKTQ